MDQPKRKLKINLEDLVSAFEHHDPLMGSAHFLDLETGDVVMTTEEDRRCLEEIFEEYGDPETGDVDWSTVLPQLDLHEWQKNSLLETDRVEAGYCSRYIGIPQVESHDGYRDMVAFIRTVSNPRLQEYLERAISGRGAFRYFKDVLMDYPKERERWFRFEEERMHQRVFDWLEAENIELTNR